MRLASYYHLPCDYGTVVMSSWENGRIVAINLCEIHAGQVALSGNNGDHVVAIVPQSTRSNEATEPPKSSVLAGPPLDARIGLTKETSAIAGTPDPGLPSSDPAEVLADEAIANLPREDFEAHGTVFERVNSSTATEETLGSSDQVHLCSRYAERCAYEATVHCPKCGRWFCDAHAEDGQWHPCLSPLRN